MKNETTQVQSRKMGRSLVALPMLATLLSCGGSFAMARDVQHETTAAAAVVTQKRNDDLAIASFGYGSSRSDVQTDGQVDEEFVAASVMTEMLSPALSIAQVGQVDGVASLYSAEMFVSNLVNSQRLIEYVQHGSDLSYWELNSPAIPARVAPAQVAPTQVASGLASGRNFIV